MELDGDILGPVRLQDARRPVAVVGDLGIGVVVGQQEVVAPRERDRLIEELERRRRRGRVVGVVQEHQLRLLERIRGDGAQIGQEAAAGPQRHRVGNALGHDRRRAVHGVAGVRYDRHVAGVQQRPGQVREPFLGADQSENVGGGLEGHAEAPAVPVRHSPLVLDGTAVGRIAVAADVGGAFHERVDDVGRRREIGIAHAEVDDVHAPGRQLLLLAVQVGEQVGADLLQSSCGLHASLLAPAMPGDESRLLYHSVDRAGHLLRVAIVDIDPADARIGPEPRVLAFGEPPRVALQRADRFFE